MERLSKQYTRHRWFSRPGQAVRAVEEVSLHIHRQTMVALIGESGSGKSTLARCLALLEPFNSGEIYFRGRPYTALLREERKRLHARVQLIFQDPASSLNPRFSAGEIVEEPLVVQNVARRDERQKRARELMDQVGLSPRWAHRRALEFSGGQRQRLAIARALALQPDFLILDESFSGLDLSLQAQLVNLLIDLGKSLGLTYLLVSHDLSLVAQISDEILIMHRGRIVESGPPRQILARPQHAHTRALIAATPVLSEAASG